MYFACLLNTRTPVLYKSSVAPSMNTISFVTVLSQDWKWTSPVCILHSNETFVHLCSTNHLCAPVAHIFMKHLYTYTLRIIRRNFTICWLCGNASPVYVLQTEQNVCSGCSSRGHPILEPNFYEHLHEHL